MKEFTQKELGYGPGVEEVRPITSRCFAIRVSPRLVPKLKNVKELSRANPKSDLFCVEVDGMNNSPEGAVQKFRRIVTEAGLGKHFGAGARERLGQ